MAIVTDYNYNLPQENSQNADAKTFRFACCKCRFSIQFIFNFCLVIFLLLFVFPFLLGDLYFSNNHISCQNEKTPVGITLSTWLEVSGYSIFCQIILIGALMILFIRNLDPGFYTGLFGVCYCIFSFVWLIIGCVIYWVYINPEKICDSYMTKYMTLRLTIGLTSVFVLFVISIIQYK